MNREVGVEAPATELGQNQTAKPERPSHGGESQGQRWVSDLGREDIPLERDPHPPVSSSAQASRGRCPRSSCASPGVACSQWSKVPNRGGQQRAELGPQVPKALFQGLRVGPSESGPGKKQLLGLTSPLSSACPYPPHSHSQSLPVEASCFLVGKVFQQLRKEKRPSRGHTAREPPGRA